MSLLLHSISSILEKQDGNPAILKSLYLYLKRGGGIPNQLQIGQFVKAAVATPDTLDLQPMARYGDRRLQRLYLKGIRKFPSSDNEYYSLALGVSDECCSCVFLGANGVGKTSLYSAIEWASLGRLDSAKCRGYDGNDEQVEFLRYHNCRLEEAEILLYSRKGERAIRLSSRNEFSERFSFPAFFCMEQDVIELSKSSYHAYIADQLGLSDFYELNDNIEKLQTAYHTLKHTYIERTNAIDELEFKFTFLTKLSRIDFDDYTVLRNASDIQSSRKLLSLKDGGRTDSIRYLNSLVRRIRRVRSIFIELLGAYPGSEEKIARLYVPFDKDELQLLDSGADQPSEDIVKDRISRIEKSLMSIYEYFSQTVMKLLPGKRDVQFQLPYLDSELDRISNRINQEKGKLHELESKCSILGVDEWKVTELNQVRTLLLQEYRKYINELVKIGGNVFSRVFRQFLGNDISDIRLEADANGRSLRIVLDAINPVDQTPLGEVNPRKYLNTFRFKLFCVSLKVALSLCCMKWYGIEFPIVIDDVFDSSDFNNRERIRVFIRNIFLSYSGLFEGHPPLQMIFFTQDDVIGDSVYRGMQESLEQGRVKYSRIFSFTEAADSEWMDGQLHGENIKVLNIEDIIECHEQNR